MSQKFSLNVNGETSIAEEVNEMTSRRHALFQRPSNFGLSNKISTIAAAAMPLMLAGPVSAQDTSFGQRLFQDKADCQYCHGIDGDGRGDPRSPGQAADLHKTILNREQLIEVITCGRPGTEMPHFDKFAYEDKSCYGRTAAELGNDTPHHPHSTSLTKREIEAVADYIIAKFVGK
jgi:mono/diheme cytochrome c family protein